MSTVDVYQGDSREVLKAFADASIDGVVCDPPYALTSIQKRFAGEGAAPHLVDGPFARASAGFMGEAWDTGETAFSVEFWREVFRVLKPGAWVVAFSATRTYHHLAMPIELAGFEIRDMIAWLYGTGFPKSKAADKAIAQWRREDVVRVRAVCRFLRQVMDRAQVKSKDLTTFFGDCNPRLIDHWAARDTDSQPSLPTFDQWLMLKDILPLGDEFDSEVITLNGRKGQAGDAWTEAEVIGEHEGVPGGFGDHRFSKVDATIRELGGDSVDWEGWGTAFKPGLEPVCVARKPLVGNLASNLLTHGCGALNIGAMRVEPGPDGRWPANVVHDGSQEVLDAFPPATGQKGSVTGDEPSSATRVTFNPRDRVASGPPRDGGGSAARFFYSAKADIEDRFGSDHPTVKPVDLMAWLVRGTVRKGGVVLDPFAGSGTTGVAALREGVNAILIEREPDHADDIRRRMAWVSGEGRLTAQELLHAKLEKDPAKAAGAGLPLFGGGGDE